MKSYYIHTIILLAALLMAGCKSKVISDDMGDAEKLEVLDLSIEKHPKDAALRAQRAQVLLNLGRAKEALLDIGRATSADPNNADYLMLQADIYFANGNVSESYKSLTAAEQLEPDNLDIQLKQGEITFYSRDYDRSLRHLSVVTEREPDNRTALFMKGFIYKEQGDTANAITLLRRVCDLYPDYEPAFEELGILYSTRKLPLAEEYLATALRIEPSNTNAMYALAMYYQGNEDLDKAEALYRQMLAVNPHSSDAWHNLGYLEMAYYGDYSRAVEFFDSALAVDPNMSEAIVNRQVALDAMKDK